MKENVRSTALFFINKHLNMGFFSSTEDQFDAFEGVARMVRQIMVIDSPDSVVVRESPKVNGGGATTHAFGLMINRLVGMDRLQDRYASRNLLPLRMIVLKVDDTRPANDAIGLMYMPADEGSAKQGVVVWISCKSKVTVMDVRALPSFCEGYQQHELSTAEVEDRFGVGFDNFALDNLDMLVGSLGQARNELRRTQYGAGVLAG